MALQVFLICLIEILTHPFCQCTLLVIVRLGTESPRVPTAFFSKSGTFQAQFPHSQCHPVSSGLLGTSHPTVGLVLLALKPISQSSSKLPSPNKFLYLLHSFVSPTSMVALLLHNGVLSSPCL